MMLLLATWLGCVLPPASDQLWMTFEPIDVPQSGAVVFADNTWIQGDVGTLGGEVIVRTEGSEILISTNRGETWTNVAPTPEFHEVAAAGDALIVFEEPSLRTVQVSRDAGSTWERFEYNTETVGLSGLTPNWMVFGTGEDVRVGLSLRNGRVERLEREEVNPGPFISAPNGAVMRADGEAWWHPYRSIGGFTPDYHPELMGWDYHTLRGQFPTHDRYLREHFIVGFTTDSRLLVRLDNEMYVSTAPIDLANDQRDQILVGPGCTGLLNSVPRIYDNTVATTFLNQTDGEIHVLIGTDDGQFNLEGSNQHIAPGTSVTITQREGVPLLAEDEAGRCLVLHHADANTTEITVESAP